MPASSDDREQLRQDHPGAAAHLPDVPEPCAHGCGTPMTKTAITDFVLDASGDDHLPLVQAGPRGHLHMHGVTIARTALRRATAAADLEHHHRRARARELAYEADFPLRDEYGFAASDAHVDVVVAAVLAHPGDAAAAARRFGLELLSNPLATRDGVPTDEEYELGIAIAVLPLAVERAHTLDPAGDES